MSVPAVAWRKPSDQTGQLTLSGDFNKGAPGDVEFALDAKGLSGSGRLDAENVTTIETAKVGSWFRGGAVLRPGQAAQVNAERIDLRYLPNSLTNGGGALALSADRLVVAKNLYVSNLSGTFAPRKVDILNGRLNGKVPVQVAISQTKKGPVYTITGSNAGEAINQLGIMDSVRDGDFFVEVAETARGLQGRFELKDIRIRTGSPLVSVLDAISVVGLLKQLDGPGIHFQTAKGNFLIADNGIELSRVNAVGASLGFTTAGIYLPASGTIDLEGTATPWYPVNGAFERTFKKPFGRERGEGLFSFTYRMRGSVDDPKVRVNPISILLPGILREIVRPKTPRLPE